MDNEARRRRVEDDDSLLASVAGVPLTRMARIGLCFVWAGFWAARALLTDALGYFEQFRLKSGVIELLGDEPVDQAFSVCMIWLSVEVATIVWVSLKKGVRMLIAKTTPSLKQQIIEELIENMSTEELEAVLERKREKERRKNEAKANGKKR